MNECTSATKLESEYMSECKDLTMTVCMLMSEWLSACAFENE